MTLECGTNPVPALQVSVQDIEGNPVEVIWEMDAAPYQTNLIPAGGALIPTNVTFVGRLDVGEHLVTVTASSGKTVPAACSTQVSVHDTAPPQIVSLTATPSVLWP